MMQQSSGKKAPVWWPFPVVDRVTYQLLLKTAPQGYKPPAKPPARDTLPPAPF
jgi:hypothetical protein